MALETKLTLDGIRSAMKTPEVREALLQMAGQIASAADSNASTPGGHVVLTPEIGDRRMRVAVLTRTFAAIRSEAKSRTLTRSLMAGKVGR